MIGSFAFSGGGGSLAGTMWARGFVTRLPQLNQSQRLVVCGAGAASALLAGLVLSCGVFIHLLSPSIDRFQSSWPSDLIWMMVDDGALTTRIQLNSSEQAGSRQQAVGPTGGFDWRQHCPHDNQHATTDASGGGRLAAGRCGHGGGGRRQAPLAAPRLQHERRVLVSPRHHIRMWGGAGDRSMGMAGDCTRLSVGGVAARVCVVEGGLCDATFEIVLVAHRVRERLIYFVPHHSHTQHPCTTRMHSASDKLNVHLVCHTHDDVGAHTTRGVGLWD